jgi:hypothetical protein
LDSRYAGARNVRVPASAILSTARRKTRLRLAAVNQAVFNIIKGRVTPLLSFLAPFGDL